MIRRVVRVAVVVGLTTLSAATGQLWERGNLVLNPISEQPVSFGSTLTTGRVLFGNSENVIAGLPREDALCCADAGRIEAFSINAGRQLGGIGVLDPGTREAGEGLPDAMLSVNLDADAFQEVVVGSPSFLPPGAGRVLVFDDLSSPQEISLATLGVSPVDANAQFGSALASGDFNGDGHPDLAIGAELEASALGSDTGRVHVIYGDGTRLVLAAHQIFEPPANEDSDDSSCHKCRFGRVLAAGNFDGDGYDDLAVSAPRRIKQGVFEAGEVTVFYGTLIGLTVGRQTSFDNASFSNLTLEEGDRFGDALAAGDFDDPGPISCLFVDCADDLAVGAPDEDVTIPAVGTFVDAGVVVLMSGVEDVGLVAAGAVVLDQTDMNLSVEPFDHFGAVLVAGELDDPEGSSFVRTADDLVIGVPDEDVGAVEDAGVVHVLFGSSILGGLSLPGQVHQAYRLYDSYPPATEARFGAAVAIGDFDADGNRDLAIGIPGPDDDLAAQRGEVQLLFGAIFIEGFEPGGPGPNFTAGS